MLDPTVRLKADTTYDGAQRWSCPSTRSGSVPTMSKLERAMIRLALRDHHSHVDDAARILGISPKGLYLKRQRLGL
jgi:DNA-binding NtrC family response regulator